jgi:hypothetical protein
VSLRPGPGRNDCYSYGGPCFAGIDIRTRRRRIGKLLRGLRRGWRPKLGLQRARARGPAFLAERRARLTEAIGRCLDESR